MKLKWKTKVVLFLLAWGVGFPLAGNAQPEGASALRAIRADASLQTQLQAILGAGIEQAYGKATPLPASLNSVYSKPIALFVTLKKGEETRGCMGTLFPRESSLAREIAVNLKKALLFDPWHRPVTRDEVEGMEIFLTAVGKIEPVRSIAAISPARDGAMIRQGAKEAVVLPGEAKTQRYLLAFLKSKAGIRSGPYQIFRMKTETISISM